MKSRWIALLVLLPIIACSDDEPGTSTEKMSTEAVCSDGAPAYEVTVEPLVTEVGPMANDLAISGDGGLWIVESGTNSVSRFDLEEIVLEPHFIDVGTERNPYSAAVDEEAGQVWVANYLSDTVSIADLDSGAPIAELDDPLFSNPSSIALSEDYAYVANVDYISPSEGYGPGSIAVVDRTTLDVISSVETDLPNPQFLTTAVIDDSPALFASLTGELEFDDGVRVSSEGGLQWFDIATDPVTPPSQTFALGQQDAQTVGAPGRPLLTPEGDRLYFASGIAPVAFAFDVDARQWIYDAQSPLQLYETDGDATHRATIAADGLLWITAFNDDQLHLWDTACDEPVAPPIDLGAVGDMLEGAQAIAVVEEDDGFTGYYLLSISNAIGRIHLKIQRD